MPSADDVDVSKVSRSRSLARSLGALPRSGPAIARLFHRLLACVFLVAWCSLGSQVKLLIGSRGLLPLAAHIAALKEEGLGFRELPTLLWWTPGDGALSAGVGVGVALSIAALVSARPRLCFGLLTALYLSYAVACRGFLGFQWDNLLIECGALATLLPADRARPWAHFLFRVLLFKLYFESGLAKLGSPIHDWHDGSAMRFYFETAPLPTRLAWYAHALPGGVLLALSWFTLFFELALPFAIFGPRRPRVAVCAILTGFQVVNQATANYGFFCLLAATLHVFLLDDADVGRARRFLEKRVGRARIVWVRARLRWLRARRCGIPLPRGPVRWRRPLAIGLPGIAVTGYLAISLLEGLAHFAGVRPPSLERGELARAWDLVSDLRLVSTYHLFAQITRERVEPTIETFDGTAWKERPLRYKPGAVDRAPPFVAPHQPRVDFLLWFYGLGFRRGTPEYVGALVDRVCTDRGAVEDLFASPLPIHPVGVRISFWSYHFTTPAERDATGAWWRRDRLGSLAPKVCDDALP